MDDLEQRKCRARPLAQAQIDAFLALLPGWAHQDGAIDKVFSFGSYAQTMTFVNEVAAIAERENHHPDMQVGYDKCRVSYRTHSVGGISENDFICAAKIEALCRP